MRVADIREKSMVSRDPEAGPSWWHRDWQENHMAGLEGARGGTSGNWIPSGGHRSFGVLQTLAKTSVFILSG